jgi:hypothetical protein
MAATEPEATTKMASGSWPRLEGLGRHAGVGAGKALGADQFDARFVQHGAHRIEPLLTIGIGVAKKPTVLTPCFFMCSTTASPMTVLDCGQAEQPFVFAFGHAHG